MLESMRCRPRLLLQSAKTDEVEREARETSAEREMTERVTFTVNAKTANVNLYHVTNFP